MVLAVLAVLAVPVGLADPAVLAEARAGRAASSRDRTAAVVRADTAMVTAVQAALAVKGALAVGRAEDLVGRAEGGGERCLALVSPSQRNRLHLYHPPCPPLCVKQQYHRPSYP